MEKVLRRVSEKEIDRFNRMSREEQLQERSAQKVDDSKNPTYKCRYCDATRKGLANLNNHRLNAHSLPAYRVASKNELIDAKSFTGSETGPSSQTQSDHDAVVQSLTSLAVSRNSPSSLNERKRLFDEWERLRQESEQREKSPQQRESEAALGRLPPIFSVLCKGVTVRQLAEICQAFNVKLPSKQNYKTVELRASVVVLMLLRRYLNGEELSFVRYRESLQGSDGSEEHTNVSCDLLLR